MARGKIIFFPDADMYLSINLLNEINQKANNNCRIFVKEKIYYNVKYVLLTYIHALIFV